MVDGVGACWRAASSAKKFRCATPIASDKALVFVPFAVCRSGSHAAGLASGGDGHGRIFIAEQCSAPGVVARTAGRGHHHSFGQETINMAIPILAEEIAAFEKKK